MKASKRKVVNKVERKERNTMTKPKPVNDKTTTDTYMKQVLNLPAKNFQIPERRATSINGLKRFSNLHSLILPSETDIKADKGGSSLLPTSELRADSGSKSSSKKKATNIISINKLEITSKSRTEIQSSISSASGTSVSCKFVINVQEEKKENKEMSRHLSVDEVSEEPPNDEFITIVPVSASPVSSDTKSVCLRIL